MSPLSYRNLLKIWTCKSSSRKNSLALLIGATSRENVSSGIFDHIRFKAACSATEASSNLETLDIASIHIIRFKKRTTKVLIRLRGCAVWSAPLLFTYDLRHIFIWPGPFIIIHIEETLTTYNLISICRSRKRWISAIFLHVTKHHSTTEVTTTLSPYIEERQKKRKSLRVEYRRHSAKEVLQIKSMVILC